MRGKRKEKQQHAEQGIGTCTACNLQHRNSKERGASKNTRGGCHTRAQTSGMDGPRLGAWRCTRASPNYVFGHETDPPVLTPRGEHGRKRVQGIRPTSPPLPGSAPHGRPGAGTCGTRPRKCNEAGFDCNMEGTDGKPRHWQAAELWQGQGQKLMTAAVVTTQGHGPTGECKVQAPGLPRGHWLGQTEADAPPTKTWCRGTGSATRPPRWAHLETCSTHRPTRCRDPPWAAHLRWRGAQSDPCTPSGTALPQWW